TGMSAPPNTRPQARMPVLPGDAPLAPPSGAGHNFADPHVRLQGRRTHPMRLPRPPRTTAAVPPIVIALALFLAARPAPAAEHPAASAADVAKLTPDLK